MQTWTHPVTLGESALTHISLHIQPHARTLASTARPRVGPGSPRRYSILSPLPPCHVLREAGCLYMMFISTAAAARGLPTLHGLLPTSKVELGPKTVSRSPTLHHWHVLCVRYVLTRSYSVQCTSPCEEASRSQASGPTRPPCAYTQIAFSPWIRFVGALCVLFSGPLLRAYVRACGTSIPKLCHERLRTQGHRLSGSHLAIGMQTDASRRPRGAHFLPQYVRTCGTHNGKALRGESSRVPYPLCMMFSRPAGSRSQPVCRTYPQLLRKARYPNERTIDH
ncbi:hypothetical protein LXA43DRAFT_134135 [Ganoderma leucocontextum]|nr:hypothetical protein LXA43DRAFT_134135 [Ganoderma leucocontextum]